MNREPLDDLADEMLGAARTEAPSEEARQRTLSALRNAQPQADLPSRSRWPVVVGMAAAAAALLALYSGAEEGRSFGISAETLEASNGETPADERGKEEQPVQSPSTSKDPIQTPEQPRSLAPSTPETSAPAQTPQVRPATLEQELERIQRARALLNSGSAAQALAQIDDFARSPGWRKLSVEASLLRIEALSQTGRGEEARQLARRFVAEHPNNPLVDRARELAGDAGANPEEERKED